MWLEWSKYFCLSKQKTYSLRIQILPITWSAEVEVKVKEIAYKGRIRILLLYIRLSSSPINKWTARMWGVQYFYGWSALPALH